MSAAPGTRRTGRRRGPVDRLRLRARWVRRQAGERRLTLPPVLVVVGSARSGRDEVVSLLGATPGLRVAGSLEFLPGLCRWFPNMDRLVGSVLRPRANENAALHVRRMLGDVRVHRTDRVEDQISLRTVDVDHGTLQPRRDR